MAVAGRVAIVPKGVWDASTSYKRLDMVANNNTLFVAKKENTGQEPTKENDYWMMCVSNNTTEFADRVAKLESPEFVEADSRGNIVAGESVAILWGKVKKFFSDLKNVAFTGNYNDLSNKPSIPSVSSSSAVTESGKYALDAREKNASVSGTLANQISELNTNMQWNSIDVDISTVKTIWTPVSQVISNLKGAKEIILHTNADISYHLACPNHNFCLTNGIPDTYNFAYIAKFESHNGRFTIVTQRVGANWIKDNGVLKITTILYR